jgi:hypothetical protein
VLVNGYEGGFDDICSVSAWFVNAKSDDEKRAEWWWGKYDTEHQADSKIAIKVIILGR